MWSSAATLKQARTGAGLSQTELARRAGTSQATLSAYERGHKQPTASTLARLVAAAGWRLTLAPAERPVIAPSSEQLNERGRQLEEVVELAESFPVRHTSTLRYPRLTDLQAVR